MLNLKNTPYLLDENAEREIVEKLKRLEERVGLLRHSGTLTKDTIRAYYGEKRFEQVAESNAIEGNTLSIGETQLAVLKGITITGHDPAYIRDAISLDKALLRLVEMARDVSKPTDIAQLLELHGLILGDRPGGGMFRKVPVIIKGASHTPPRTWEEVMEQMEGWENWSRENHSLAAPIRATILHAWLTHIHPFVDGNGRASRAISNLELVRAGYPPIIIRKKERDRYIQALGESDTGGDIRSFFELMLDRIDGSLLGLELSAKQQQGYNPAQEKIRIRQEQLLRIFDTSIQLLVKTVEHYLVQKLESVHGSCFIKQFDFPLDLDDYVSICEGKSTSHSWSFIINLLIPGLEKHEWLAYIGHRSSAMYHGLNNEGGPSIFWSVKNPAGYPKWITDSRQSPYCVEMTTKLGIGDQWYVRKADGSIENLNTTGLANKIALSLFELAGNKS